MEKRSTKLFERLLDTDVKADLLTLYHNNANLSDTLEGLAKRIGRSPAEVQREVKDLVELGILRKSEVYSFGSERDREIQDAISKQLALGETAGLPGLQVSTPRAQTAQIQKATTGLDILDRVLPGGLPTTSTVLILSDPGAGEESLLAHFVSQQMGAGKPVLFITLDNFPANIMQMVQPHLGKDNVDSSTLIFVDGYSRTVGVESEARHVVDPENLSSVSIAMSDVMSKTTVSLMVLDSFNTLIRKRGFRSAVEFLYVLVARTRQAKCLGLVTMNRKAFPFAMVASVQDIVDGVIELRAEESYEGIARSLRILKMVGAKHLTTWTPYKISDEGKFIQSRPRKITGTLP